MVVMDGSPEEGVWDGVEGAVGLGWRLSNAGQRE